MIFKRKKEYILYRTGLPLLANLIFAFNIRLKWWQLVSILLFTVVFMVFDEFNNKKLYCVLIEPERIIFYYYMNFRRRAKVCSPQDVSYYNDPYSTGLTSKAERRLWLYFKGRTIVSSIGKSFDGWDYHTIYSVIDQFETLGIRKEKYFHWD